MLNLVCGSDQFLNIYNDSLPYCGLAEINTEADCRCCATLPGTPDAFLCSDLATPLSQPGGILALLAKYDHGLKISDQQNDQFLFVDGVYTPHLKRSTPNQILNGYPSGYVGFLTTQQGILSSGLNDPTVQEAAQVTSDMRDVCYPLYCPQYQDLAAGAVAAGLDFTYFQNVSCAGLVPGTDVLMEELGMTEDQANQYRYLEGSQCDAMSTSVILASLVTAIESIGLPSYLNCANPDDVMPCCPANFSAGGLFEGSALGCLAYVAGMYQTRRVFSNAEADEYYGTENINVHKTGCASSKEKFEQITFKGETNFTQWYTPENYEYGVTSMSWADPSVYRYGTSDPANGQMLIGNVSGKQFSFREGRGVTSEFLEYQLTDGDPKSNEDEIWVPYRRKAINTLKTGHRKVSGVHVNDFFPDYTVDYSASARAEAEMSGEVPFPNVQNMMYITEGKPAITSYPNFYLTETPEALSQLNNSERKAPPGGGVSLFRTVSSYPDGKLLSEPELITTETWDQFGKKYFDGFQSIEPATGATIAGQITNMMSVFSWNCNPELSQSFCDLMTYVNNGTMCYADEEDPYMYPCGATNVFTPMVQGGKVNPIWWLFSTPDAEEVLSCLRIRSE